MVAEKTVYDLGGWSLLPFLGPSLTPPGSEGLDGRELGPSDVLGRMHTTLCSTLRSYAKQLPDQVVMLSMVHLENFLKI